MAASNRELCFKHVGAAEGGYSNRSRADDPGGPTRYGVTAATLGAWRKLGREATAAEVKAMPKTEAIDIYKAQYWDTVNGDKLPEGLDLAVFDFSINSGPRRAAEELQRVVGAKVDGFIGAGTLGAVEAFGVVRSIEKLCARRLAFMRRLSNWGANKNGWTTRVNAVQSAAVKMALGNPAPKPAGLPATATGKADATHTVLTKTPTGAATVAAGGGASILAAKEVVEAAGKIAEPVKGHVGDGFIGHAATLILIVIILIAVAVVGYQIWRKRAEERGQTVPPTLLKWVLQAVGAG